MPWPVLRSLMEHQDGELLCYCCTTGPLHCSGLISARNLSWPEAVERHLFSSAPDINASKLSWIPHNRTSRA